jgi:Amt family ammonium transporter
MLINKKNISRLSLGLLIIISLIAAFVPVNIIESNEQYDSGKIAWMLMASAMVLIMTPGLSFFYGGMVSSKNIISTMLQSFVALGVITIIWYTVGFSLAFGESFYGIIGNPTTYFFMNNVGLASNEAFAPGLPFILFAAFQLKFAIITPALITGSFAERVKFWGYIIFMCLFSLLIYCPLAHWTWHPDGFLKKWGVLDFAGGTVVHISAGVAALAGALYLGKRNVKQFHVSTTNTPYVILGTGLLWFGWFGFNSGSALAADKLAVQAFITTNLASACAMITWIVLDTVRGHKPTALGACIGAVVGLVAITPAAGFVDYGHSIFIGVVASLISNFAVSLKNKFKIDDTLDVFPCHGVGGIVGMILTAIFAYDVGLIHGNYQTILYHLIALVIVVVFVFSLSLIIYRVTNIITPLRVSASDEIMGLDMSQHKETIYEEMLQN